MSEDNKLKTLVQCDFDGTLTEEDVSFLILDSFADGDWRKIFEDYKEGRISVGSFNKLAFQLVKADEETLKKFIKKKTKIRDGLLELLELCRANDFRFVIVSNGLEFYINIILEALDVDDVEVFAAQAVFHPDGIIARYIGPDGNEIQNGFKEAYIRYFLNDGYWIIYIGNGDSDILPARLAGKIFATDTMLTACRRMNVECIPFTSLNDIIKNIKSFDQS
jgi:2-hydroxy-3-keto-5-methylthiopentenyl-1-phosphate phosphatase